MAAITPEIDRFCSSSGWVLPAREAFFPGRPTLILRSAAGFGAFLVEDVPGWGKALLPLEASWMLACPVVGRDPAAFFDELRERLQTEEARYQVLVLAGLPPDGVLWRSACSLFAGSGGLYSGLPMIRRQASLAGGLAGFLERRNAKFRKNLRRIQRVGRAAGLRFEFFSRFADEAEIERVFERIMALEHHSWKGKMDAGIQREPMRTFYHRIWTMLAPCGRMRAGFAVLDGRDAGYIFGAVFGPHFRGFQLSFADDLAALSIGNLLQIELIQRLCDEGIEVYDLGMDMAYKLAWSEIAFETRPLLVRLAT